jgi:putative nucleotidyltransferase with HDIG domain
VAARLYALKEDGDMRGVAALIGTDPSLSALVLRLVNSPLFGLRHPVDGILQAVALLGLDRLRALATTAAFRMLVNPSSPSPALMRCWRHSVACALATREVAMKSAAGGDAAYTAGLLHDIGCFAMLSCWPREYSHLLDTCQPAKLLEGEFELMGVSHTDAGAFLLQRWGLPPELVNVAREHHCPPREGEAKHVDLVWCGCHIADAVGFTVTAKRADDTGLDESLSSLVSDPADIHFRIADGINQLECFGS